MLYGLGKLMVRLRWAVIALWALLFALALVVAPKVTSQLTGGFGEANTESDRAFRLIQEKLGIPESSITLVFYSNSLVATDPQYIQQVDSTLAPLRDLPDVRGITSFYSTRDPEMVSPDGHTTYAVVSLDMKIGEAMDVYPDIRSKLAQPPTLQMWVTGGVPIFSEVNRLSERDLQRAEVIAFPLVLVALVAVFGSLVAAGLPVIMGAVAVGVTIAIIYLLAQVMGMSIFVLNIATFLGLGLAIDYSLLVVSRFREEIVSRGKEEAIAVTMATAGRAIVFSGLTSALGLSGLIFFKFMMLRSLGIGGAAVILLSMLVALTLLPASLAVMGRSVNRFSLLPVRPARQGMWRRLAFGVMRHPLLVALPVVAVLVVLGLPFLNVRIGEPWASILPKSAEPRQGWEFAQEKIGPGALSPALVVVQAKGNILGPEQVGALYDLAHSLESDPRVERVESIVTLDPRITKEHYQLLYANPAAIPVLPIDPALKEGAQAALKGLAAQDTTLVSVYTRYPPVSDESKALVKDIRSMSTEAGLETYVTGATAELIDSVDVMYRDFPKIIFFIVITTYLALLWLFRSLVLPLKAVVMNTLSIFASYGALVFIFQEGHFQQFMGFTAEGYIEASVPILMFSIIFGLSMDYEVFLLSRVKEAYDRTGDNALSVAEGLEHTGQIITSAALILVLVAAAFATGEIVIVKALGVGTAIAVFVDSTIVRALLVPALMRLLGDWNWWVPRFLKRIIPEQKMPL